MQQNHLIEKTDSPQNDKIIPVESMIKSMKPWEQYAACVVDYTSKYNMNFSISYAPENLAGKYVKYPAYGDSTETYTLRTYGKWWNESEAYQQPYMPQEIDPLGAEDYVTLGFKDAVVPRDVCIYETYNPGAVVRIWGRYVELDWMLLWEGPPKKYPQAARKFHPKIRLVNRLINQVRIEFNQSHLKYHTSIDAVLLGGYRPPVHNLPTIILQKDLLKWCTPEERKQPSTDSDIGQDYFSRLPHEVIVQIFQNLDLKALSRCAQVNRAWREATMDPILYHNISLKKYWHTVTAATLDFFKKRCQRIKKLDLSWCGNVTASDSSFSKAFVDFCQQCCQQLTHLSLCHCSFVNKNVLEAISACQGLTELRLGNAKTELFGFHYLARLNKLITLDLSSTNITDDHLIAILKANPALRHLILDFCESLERLDEIVETVAAFNKQLTTWSSFKATSLTSLGTVHFARCANLKELDLGWCLLAHPGDCLEKIAMGCRNLKRLIVCKWPGLNDQMLLPVVYYCKNLTQLDLLGIRTITGDICEKALVELRDLRLLDISFCDSVVDEQVTIWRREFPQVTIQRSCEYELIEYLN